ncbi:MAG: dTDP-4-dehydrorhamnose 3,5-epimerase [Planctomycetota bacterium]|nr:dTDP-4-dehydrorhamnose 3,5-epimerase [Planctomycetota bacterium]MDA1113678.1 dTDP-4-dehydrorhamnose 3,5-epimerase [Planctomycetota bacterium]
MKVEKTALDGVLILKPNVHGDERGFFMESWNRRTFKEATGIEPDFVQDNHSSSTKGVLRGLHLQRPPVPQGKLVRIVSGSVFDVAVDVNPSSPTYKQWVGVELSAENHKQLWIPAGYAHGFLTLSDHAEMLYKATNFYAPETECCVLWNDAEIAVNWPLEADQTPTLSDKDLKGIALKELESQGALG